VPAHPGMQAASHFKGRGVGLRLWQGTHKGFVKECNWQDILAPGPAQNQDYTEGYCLSAGDTVFPKAEDVFGACLW
jgi:hypothetical protein